VGFFSIWQGIYLRFFFDNAKKKKLNKVDLINLRKLRAFNKETLPNMTSKLVRN